MQLEVTTNVLCPVRCWHCPQDVLAVAYDGPAMMSLDSFRRWLPRLAPGEQVTFAGMSEPFANPCCVDMAESAADAGHPLAVYTTTVGLRAADVARLGALRWRQFVIHRVPSADRGVVDAVAEAVPGVQFELRHAGNVHTRAGNLSLPGAAVLRRRAPVICRSAGARPDHSVLMPDGRLVLCCMDYGLRHVLGDLGAASHTDLLASASATSVFAGLRTGSPDVLCLSCENAVEVAP